MRIGIVGYQGTGKSTVFELLTGVKPDIAKAHQGQVGIAIVPDERFDKLVELYHPKKETPARIELFDTPGLSRDDQSSNAQRLGVIRESAALVQVVGAFSGRDPVSEVDAFRFKCARELFLRCGLPVREASSRSLLLYAYVFGQSLMVVDQFDQGVETLRADIMAMIAGPTSADLSDPA